MSKLYLHAGARNVTRDELTTVATPDGTRTHHPIPHAEFLTRTEHNLASVGWRTTNESFGLWGDSDEMFFGVLDLTYEGGAHVTPVPSDFTMSVGIRNSHNKRFSAGVTAGTTVFVCDNMAFNGDVAYFRKHTRGITSDLEKLLFIAALKLIEHVEPTIARYDSYRHTRLTDLIVHDFLIKSVDEGVIPVTKIAPILAEWREPSHDEFAEERNAWRLFNAYTEALKGTNPTDLRRRTQRLEVLTAQLVAQEA